MKTEAAILVETGQPLVMAELGIPALKPGQVLVEIAYSGACGTQVMEWRGDAAFASPGIYDYLEAGGFGYAIRLPANTVLQQSIAHLLKRPVGRPPKAVRRYMPASATRPRAGAERGVLWPRSNGIRASCIPASATSSPT